MDGESPDACLQLVAHRHRRRILDQLRLETDGETRIDDLVDRLHQAESVAADRRMTRDQLALRLHHAHLPRLAKYGIVEFDHEPGTVEYYPDEQIETILDSLPDEVALANP